MFSEKRKLLKKHKFVLLKRKFLKKLEVYESTRFIKAHIFKKSAMFNSKRNELYVCLSKICDFQKIIFYIETMDV